MAVGTTTAIIAGTIIGSTIMQAEKQKKEAKAQMKEQKAQQLKQEKQLQDQETISKANENRSRQLSRQRAMAAGVQGRSSTLLGGTTGGAQVSGGKSLLGV